jgi:hypothetical protein
MKNAAGNDTMIQPSSSTDHSEKTATWIGLAIFSAFFPGLAFRLADLGRTDLSPCSSEHI